MSTRLALTIATLLSAGALAVPGAASAAYPGANGELAFTSTQDGGARHIFVATGSGLVDLTGVSSPASDIQPKFSPDGREILFTRYAPGLSNAEVFVMGADGAQPTQLTNNPTGSGDATWSPDGTEVAFVSERANAGPNIFIMRADGTGLRQVTHDTAGKSELAWSPRGDRIAFVRVPAGGGDREIYSVKTDGSGLTDLSNDPTSFDLDPAWSPDGTKLAYSGPFQPGESVGMDLWIMNADGSGRRALVHENNKYSDGAYPAWSPDGTTVAFTANNGTGYYHVWSIPAAGGQNAELVTNKVAGGNPVDQQVDWQPAPTRAVPKTRIAGSVISEHGARFSFEATGPATGYRCALSRETHKAAFKPCSSGHAYRHLKPGHYTFSVIASGPGEPYRTPARRTFKIR